VATDIPKVNHNSIVPFDYGTLRKDAATFYVNNKVFDGFKNIKIARNMMSLTGTFNITITDKWQVDQEDFEIKPGDRIHCHLGKTALFEGYVDKLSLSLSASSRNITIQGRDKTQDLVDCSITTISELNDLDFTGIATELCKPFSIKVLPQVSVGAKFPKFSVRQGETPFEALDRAAKERQLILLSSTHGNLVVEKRGNKRAVTELIEGVNVLSASANFDNTQRFSEYVIKGQSTGILGTPKDATQNKGSAKDSGVTRYRPTLIISENAVDNDGAQKRAEFESTFRIAKAAKVNVVVVGWKQKDGSLWDVNQLVQIDIKSIGINGQMLIERVKFDQSENGRRVEMELIRPDAFEFKAEIKKEDDILDQLGWDDKK
jgi:prophage tail gpP-like protein